MDKPIWIAADAEDHFGTTFLGFHLSNGRIATFHTRYLGMFGFVQTVSTVLLDISECLTFDTCCVKRGR